MMHARDHAARTSRSRLTPPPDGGFVDTAPVRDLRARENATDDLGGRDGSEGGGAHGAAVLRESQRTSTPIRADSRLDSRCVRRNALRSETRREAGGNVVLIGTMPDIDRRWFTATLSDRKISQRQLAKKLQCDPASVHRLLTGKRPMRLDEATNIAHLLGVPVTDVLEHAGLEIKGERTVPLVGFVDGNGEALLDWNARGAAIPAPADLPPLAVAVQLRTASTALDAMDGWTLFTTIPNGVAPDAMGRLSLVGVVDRGVQLLRFVRRGYTRGRFNLVYPGVGDLHDAELDWATPVLHIRP